MPKFIKFLNNLTLPFKLIFLFIKFLIARGSSSNSANLFAVLYQSQNINYEDNSIKVDGDVSIINSFNIMINNYYFHTKSAINPLFAIIITFIILLKLNRFLMQHLFSVKILAILLLSFTLLGIISCFKIYKNNISALIVLVFFFVGTLINIYISLTINLGYIENVFSFLNNSPTIFINIKNTAYLVLISIFSISSLYYYPCLLYKDTPITLKSKMSVFVFSPILIYFLLDFLTIYQTTLQEQLSKI